MMALYLSLSIAKFPFLSCRSGTRPSERGTTFDPSAGGHLVAMGDVVFMFQRVL